MTHTSRRSVTFPRPFLLPGMDRPHAAGTFEVQTVDEPIDVSWEAYHRRITIMLTSGGMTEAWPITEADLEVALAADPQSASDEISK